MLKVGIMVADINLRGGGERVAINMANYFSEEYDYQVSIISILKVASGPCFKLGQKVTLSSLGLSQAKNKIQGVWNKINAVKQIRSSSAVRDLDCIIGIGTFASCLITQLPNSHLKRIGTEHMSFINAPKVWQKIRAYCYPKLDEVVFLTNHDCRIYGKGFSSSSVIPNCRPFTTSRCAKIDSKQILNVGRLEYQKNQHYLIDVFSKIAKKHPDWKLKIIGDGGLQQQLIKKIENLGLSHQISIIAGKENIIEDYLESSIFVMTSRAEGFPMVLLESQACGLPMVSVDCPTGPEDIITHGVDGYVLPIEDEQEMIEKLSILMSNASIREEMSQNAKHLSERYDPENIFPKWRRLIEATD